ncbi:hypothetical protein KAR91_11360 [Candidatus Pacearchaeota archaeon]|nr:hypothetical protein [Candidatus Pacearchaeota archaeon]
MKKRGRRSVNFILIGIFLISLIGVVSSLSISTHVLEKYTEVSPGERFYFEVEIKYPENLERKDLRLEYNVLYGDEVVLQSKVLKAVETQISFLDYLVIPSGLEPGLYTLRVKILDYEELSEEVEASFYVIPGDSLELRVYFYALLSSILIVGFIVFFGVSIHRKKQSSRLELELFGE